MSGKEQLSEHFDSAADEMRDRYGYTPRPGQSGNYLTVPAALIEEARDACSPGDARSLLERCLEKGRRS